MRFRSTLLLPLLAAVALTITSCAAGTTGSTGAADDSAATSTTFPVTIEHAYGSTTVESKPKRVATIAWANADAALALGVTPVGMAAQPYGDDDGDGILGWTEDALTAADATTPTLFDETDGIDFEAVANSKPDIILAAYSGITKADYATLSKIAPVVAFPEKAYGTSWRDTILIDGTALGLEKQAKAYISKQDAAIETAVAAYPAIAGKTAMFSWLGSDMSKLGYYTASDARAMYLDDLGLKTPASITKLTSGATSFFGDVSAENVDVFDDVDIIFGYGDSSTLAQLQADPLLGRIPAIARGSVVFVKAASPLAAAVSPPDALSLPWSLADYVAQLGSAAALVK
jgi:iron complex transport system substrate-binding protein